MLASRTSVNSPSRSMMAEKPASAPISYTTRDTSPRMWLKADELWLMTPNSMSPLKYRGAMTAAGSSEMR